MKPRKILLIRHGQSIGNIDRSVYNKIPDYALNLTMTGVDQVLESGVKIRKDEGIKNAAFYISPFWRTRRTFEILNSSIKCDKFYEDPRLREQDWGNFRDIQDSEAIEKIRDSYGTFYYRFPEGESCADVYDRVSDSIATMYRDFEKKDFPENVIIVTHGMTMRVWVMRFLHYSVEEFEKWKNPSNAAYTVLELGENSKYSLKYPFGEHTVGHSYQYNWEKP